MKKETWKSTLKRLFTNWYISRFNEQKAIAAFEFAIVLSDAAHDMGIKLTPEIVLRAEDMIPEELGKHSAEHFAAHLKILLLAVLEPQD